MKRLLNTLLHALIFLPMMFLLSIALAQTVGDTLLPSFDFKAWGSSAALYGVFVAAAVSLIKGRVPALSGWKVLVLAFVLSELGAFLLFTSGLLTDNTFSQFAPPFIWLLFGFAAWVAASGGYAVLVQLLTARKSVVALPAQVIAAPQVLHKIGTPGSQPLHDTDGMVIGAVKPLSPTDGLERAK